MDTRSFNIPASNKSMVEEQIEKLNKRAKKLGLDPISLTWGKAILTDKDETVLPCELTGPLSVSYDGWEFIATLQHLPTGENIIRAISDEYMIPLEYRDSGSACEHCQVKRYRKDTYVVRHHTGDARQVGSTCIKDFLGGNSPDNIMQRASFVGELLSFMEGAGSSPQGHDEGIFHIVSFLAQTSACIRDYGWLSKGEAYKAGGTSTAVRVQDNYNPPPGFKRSEVTAEDKQKAILAAEWAENISDEDAEPSDYLYNIRAIARSGMVGWRTMGYAASILSAYERTLRDKTPKMESEHVGILKKREIFDLTVKKVSGFDGPYGYTNKYVFQDALGNVVVWLSSVSHPLEEGKKYSIKGTVKAHTEYRGLKQTEINRCEVMTHYE
jgi:hypothetical protein